MVSTKQEEMSFGQLAGAIARRIVGGEKPSFVSARDGRLLRRVPGRVRVDNSTLAVHIEGALQEVPGLAAIVEMATGSTGTRCNQETTSIKSLLYLARCHAYRRAGQAEQAASDGRSALSHSVQGVQRTQARLALGLALLAARQCTEAAMHLWHALHGNGCTVLTGLAADEATRWGDEEIDRDSGFEDWVSQQYYRARKQCPVDHKVALDAGGAEGLERWLEVEREREMPEALRPRPKYYYYYEWMKQRIAKCFPDGLPAPVQDKLLAMDADELDLMLEHPAAIADRVSLLEGVLEEHGPDYLGTYRPPELSWEDVKQLTGPGTVGLGLGNQVARIAGEEEMMALPGAAPGSLTIEAPRDEETEGPGGAALVASAADLDELD